MPQTPRVRHNTSNKAKVKKGGREGKNQRASERVADYTDQRLVGEQRESCQGQKRAFVLSSCLMQEVMYVRPCTDDD